MTLCLTSVRFYLMSIQVEVLCSMWSALYSTRLDVYLNKFSTTATKVWPSTEGLIQSVKHASSQEVLLCQHRWKEQKTDTTYNSCIAEISVSTLSGCTHTCSSKIKSFQSSDSFKPTVSYTYYSYNLLGKLVLQYYFAPGIVSL